MKISITLPLLMAVSGVTQAANLADISPKQLTLASYQVQTKPMVNANKGMGAIYFEDFQSQTLPAGWVLFNLDGLTPVIAEFTDAWIVIEDIAPNYALASTSWYNPAGTSDDWAISPAIAIPSQSRLKWRARAVDENFPDGYEVYISTTTADTAGCGANPPIFSIAAENVDVYTEHEVNLSAEGYGNESIFVCFRNNSNDQFILLVDDIGVYEIFDNDVSIDSVADVPEYSQTPQVFNTEIPLSVTISNPGNLDQSNILVTAEVFADNISVYMTSDVIAGPLSSDAQQLVDLGSFSTNQVGIYRVEYAVELNGAIDENPSNNAVTVDNVVTITADTMARDEDTGTQGTLGIGAENGGYVGQEYTFDVPVTITAVNFIHDNDDCDPNPPNECALDEESIQVDVFSFNENTQLPDQMIASSEAYVVPAGSAEATSVEVAFTNGLDLAPGRYLFALTEPVRQNATFSNGNVQLHTSTDRFTAGKMWVDWPTNPNGQWSNSEDFGFNIAYLLRLKFSDSDLIFEDDFE